MCKVYYQQNPVCSCVVISAVVELCAVFYCLPENKGKTAFRPKILTAHCHGLNLCFNGVDYVSADVEGGEADFAPKGLDCPHVEVSDAGVEDEEPWSCDLCDSEAALKFLKAKGIKHTFDKAAREREKAAEQGEEEAAAKAVGKSKGKAADRAEGSSSGVEGAGKEFSRAQEMMEKRVSRATGKKARSGLAQSTSASAE